MLSPEAAGIKDSLFCVIERGKITIKSRTTFFDYGVFPRACFNLSVNIQLRSVLNSANKVNLKQTIITVLEWVKHVKIILTMKIALIIPRLSY